MEKLNKSVFITGIAGFICSNLANRLHELGYEVSGCDNLQFGYEQNVNPNIKWEQRPFQEIETEIINRHDVLVHAATLNIIYAQENPIETFKNNALDGIELFNRYLGQIVYISTSSVYGCADSFPTKENAEQRVSNAYDQSKLILEKYLENIDDFTILRLSNVWGINQRMENPYSGVCGKFIGNALSNQPIEIIGDGSQTRDFNYISDVVDAIILAIDHDPKNEVINIGSGKETSVLELASLIWKEVNKPSQIKYIPKRSIDGINRRCLDNSRAKELLGWEPKTTLEEGIRKTIEWVKNEKGAN